MEDSPNMIRLQNLLYKDFDDIDSHARSKNDMDSQDIGMINQESGAGINVTASGNIEIMADKNLGIYIDKESREVIVIGDGIKMITPNFGVIDIPYKYIKEDEQEVLSILKGGNAP